MKNNIYGLLLISTLCYGDSQKGTIPTQKPVATETIKLHKTNKPKKTRVETFTLSQLISAACTGFCGGVFSQKPTRLVRFVTLPTLAICSVATVAPKYIQSCGKSIYNTTLNTLHNKTQHAGERIQNYLAQLEKSSATQSDADSSNNKTK